jgi:hypothetical protein
MSGYNSRFLYDQCTIDQNLKSSTDPCRYQLMLDKFENINMTIKNGPCQGDINKKMKCDPCNDNRIANIEAKWDTIGLRTEIESDLWAINRPNTRCVDLKYHPCGPGCNKQYCSKTCPNHVIVNTRLCDRNIVPTNNKMPVRTGF